ncbi:MAG: hypothetical protein WBC99_00345, partial [Candidatus Omnitrophota bacterium]
AQKQTPTVLIAACAVNWIDVSTEPAKAARFCCNVTLVTLRWKKSGFAQTRLLRIKRESTTMAIAFSQAQYLFLHSSIQHAFTVGKY